MLAEIEDNIIAAIKTEFGNTLRQVDSHPGTWDEETLKQMSLAAPGVLVGFGDADGNESETDVVTNGKWHLYIVTAHANGQKARRRGDGRVIGAYEILERLVPLLHGHNVTDLSAGDDIGTLNFERGINRFTFSIDRKGFLVYEVRYSMRMLLSRDVAANLEPFITYHADHLHSDDPNVPISQDEVTLEQP